MEWKGRDRERAIARTLLRLLRRVVYSSRTSCSSGETEGAEDAGAEGAMVESAIFSPALGHRMSR